MKNSWDPSFDPLIKYIKFANLPPFTSHSKLVYIQSIGNCIFCIRSLIILALTEKGEFTELFSMCTMTVQFFLKGIVILYNRKLFTNHFYEMNKFIRNNKFNPINGEEDQFLKLWKSNSVFKHTKRYIMLMFGVAISWQLEVLYEMAIDLENRKEPYYPFYSPGFDYNSYTKIVYTLFDIMLDWNSAFTALHNEVVFMLFLNFLHCQYAYLKNLFDLISIEKGNDKKMMRWWILNHASVVRSTLSVKKLLAPIVAIHSICTMAGLASCVMVLTESKSAQSESQKSTMVFMYSVILLVIGYNCDTMERINQINKTIPENLNQLDAVKDKFGAKVTFSMISYISQKPIKLSGLGFFDFDNEGYNALIVRTYSFYSSLTAVKMDK